MPSMEKNVYEFEISLKGIEPKIWRKIQVPEDYTFFYFSQVINNAIGWSGHPIHLHRFEMNNPETDSPEIIGEDPAATDSSSTLDERDTAIKDLFVDSDSRAIFIYDLGCHWEHDVKLTRILPEIPGKTYPVCIGGERACPSEHCDGFEEYQELLDKKAKPKDELTEEEERQLDVCYMGDDFDPEFFDPDDVDLIAVHDWDDWD
ncbi:uncharacterized protein y4hQ-like [Leptopilina heterotoma]|uniref:uncharacterized protein y4hQ-like n=1 Tax=Leptopilina heterotoma TaxID=63436 RepID=UPI001CA9B1EF|nr:uncharacterized protein y4hQ-like [Leptopilina heterotoma]XP_043471475.1 uncharacterized protein y4hQ-like [Leptopilina heterotoma]XP_043471476.1 uncharacterized protein y4hQ-like [Leptopilina heterotoma]